MRRRDAQESAPLSAAGPFSSAPQAEDPTRWQLPQCLPEPASSASLQPWHPHPSTAQGHGVVSASGYGETHTGSAGLAPMPLVANPLPASARYSSDEAWRRLADAGRLPGAPAAALLPRRTSENTHRLSQREDSMSRVGLLWGPRSDSQLPPGLSSPPLSWSQSPTHWQPAQGHSSADLGGALAGSSATRREAMHLYAAAAHSPPHRAPQCCRDTWSLQPHTWLAEPHSAAIPESSEAADGHFLSGRTTHSQNVVAPLSSLSSRLRRAWHPQHSHMAPGPPPGRDPGS